MSTLVSFTSMTSRDPFDSLTQTFSIGSVLSTVLALPKFILLVIVMGFTLTYSVAAALFPVRAVGRIITRVYSKTLVRIALFLAGVVNVHEQPTPLVDTYSEVTDVREPRPGDVIVANLSSYLNLLWLQSKYSPVFVVPVDDQHVVVKDALQMFMQIIGRVDVRKGRQRTMASVVETARNVWMCPIVLFPEAAVTNGTCVIQFQRFAFGQDLETTFHVYGFVHSSSDVSPNFVRGNGTVHLFRMLGRSVARINVKVALPQDVPNGVIDDKFIQRCRFVLAAIMNVPLVDSVADDSWLCNLQKLHGD